MRTPWLWAALALVFGAEGPLWLTGLVGLAVFVLGRRRGWARRPTGLLVVSMLGGALSAASVQAWSRARPDPPVTPTSGEVLFVDVGSDGARVLVAPDAAPGHRIRLRVPTRPRGLAPGARVLVTGELSRPAPADNPGMLDYEAWCARRRIAWLGRGGVEILEPAGPLAEGVVVARARARAAIDSAAPTEGGALLLGLLLGDQSTLPLWISRAFEATGTTHLLSVSGLHVSGVALLAFGLGRRLGRRFGAIRPDVPGALLALPASILFVALAQFPVAGVRSGLMVVLALLGRLMARRADGRNLIGLTALIVLADDPGLVREPAFQLSFCAVLALVLFAGEGRGLPGLLRASVVASLITFPIQCAHFGTVSPFSPLANLLVVPAASAVVVPLGLLGLVLHPWVPGLIGLAAQTALALASLTEVLAEFGGEVRVPGAWAALLVALPGVVGVAWLWFGPRVALGLGFVLFPVSWGQRPPEDTVDFIAVGQGDAILVRSGGRAMLVDCGPDPDATVLRAFLRHTGVSRLDAVAISHAHPDHFGGLIALAQRVHVTTLYTNGNLGRGAVGAEMAHALAMVGLSPRPPPAEAFLWGELWLWFTNVPAAAEGPATAEVPATADVPAAAEGPAAHGPEPDLGHENDASLVLRIDGPGGAVLLPGDIEAAAENVLAEPIAARGAIDVLKAPHHGSRTSSTPRFLDRLHPRAVVFTVGRANRFHFPRPQIQARYSERGIRQWQTDTDGAVRLVFDQDALVMSAFHRDGVVTLPFGRGGR